MARLRHPRLSPPKKSSHYSNPQQKVISQVIEASKIALPFGASGTSIEVAAGTCRVRSIRVTGLRRMEWAARCPNNCRGSVTKHAAIQAQGHLNYGLLVDDSRAARASAAFTAMYATRSRERSPSDASLRRRSKSPRTWSASVRPRRSTSPSMEAVTSEPESVRRPSDDLIESARGE
jgi:hypothetical protein